MPEEVVRQDLLFKMINKLGFPKALLSVEVDLASISHLKNIKRKLPKRRADIISFAKNKYSRDDLYPLLMVECKAHKLTQAAIDQVIGYNHFVNAAFIAVANSFEIKTFWYDIKAKNYNAIDFLPSYNQLLNAVTKR